MVKIAFVSDAIYPYNKGGKEKRLYDISTRLVTMGYEVHIYTMKWWKNGKSIKKENGVILHAISPLSHLYDGPRRSIKQAVLFGLACLKLIREDFDIIEVDHMPFFPLYTIKLVCVLKNKKMQATWHEVWGKEYWLKYAGWKGWFGYLMEKFSVYTPNKIVSVSKLTTDRLRNSLGYRGEIVTITNGVNTEEIALVKPAREKSDVIFAGRLLAHKNVDALIEAVSLIPQIKCIIVGEGPEKSKLIKLSKELKLENRVKFYDFFPEHATLFSLIKSSKVFVLPSTREGFGITVLEAKILK